MCRSKASKEEEKEYSDYIEARVRERLQLEEVNTDEKSESATDATPSQTKACDVVKVYDDDATCDASVVILSQQSDVKVVNLNRPKSLWTPHKSETNSHDKSKEEPKWADPALQGHAANIEERKRGAVSDECKQFRAQVKTSERLQEQREGGGDFWKPTCPATLEDHATQRGTANLWEDYQIASGSKKKTEQTQELTMSLLHQAVGKFALESMTARSAKQLHLSPTESMLTAMRREQEALFSQSPIAKDLAIMYNAGSIEAAAAARTEKSDHGILNTSPTAHQPLNSPSRTKAPSVMAAAQERLRAALATDSYSKPVAAQQCMRYNSGVAAGACDTIQVLSPAVAASASHPYLSKTPDNSTRGDSGTPRTSARLGNGTPRTSARWGNGTVPAVAVGAPVVSRQELAVSAQPALTQQRGMCQKSPTTRQKSPTTRQKSPITRLKSPTTIPCNNSKPQSGMAQPVLTQQRGMCQKSPITHQKSPITIQNSPTTRPKRPIIWQKRSKPPPTLKKGAFVCVCACMCVCTRHVKI